MKAWVRDRYGAPGALELKDVTMPVAEGSEVLVRLRAASLNQADLDYLYGRPMLTRMGTGFRRPRNRGLGLDAAGVVEAVGGGVTRVKPGDHVVLNWAPACGTCFYCQHDQPNLCETFTGPIWAGTMLNGTPRLV